MLLRVLKPLVLLLTLPLGCGGSTESREISQPPIRTGGQLESIPVAFHDIGPTISADGTKILFVSGRDTTDDAPQLRVYRADWPSDGVPGEPERVTAEDLGFETSAQLSPDGSTVALIVASGGQDNVYRIPYAGGTMTAITEDGGEKGGLAFTDDSALLAWRQIDGDGRRVFVADLVGGDPVALSFDGSVERVFWIPTGTAGSYRIAVSARDSATGLSQIQTATIATAAAAGSATLSAVGDAFVAGDVSMVASTDAIFATLQPLPLGAETSERLGDFEVGEEDVLYTSDVDNRPLILDADTGTRTEPAEVTGDAVLSPEVVADGFNFLSRRAFRCVGDSGVLFGWSMIAMTADTATTSRYLPLRNSAGNWEVATGPCDKLGTDEVAGLIDHRMQNIAVASAGSTTAFRAVYETRFSATKDTECRLKAGDPEIRVMSVSADSSIVADVSANQYDALADTDRGDKGPCP